MLYLVRKGYPIWVFQTAFANEYKQFLPYLPSLLYIDIYHDRMNPLEDEPLWDWNSTSANTCSLFCQLTGILIAGTVFITMYCRELHAMCRPLGIPINFRQLYDYMNEILQTNKGIGHFKFQQYFDAIWDRLTGLILSFPDEYFRVSRGFDYRILAQRSILWALQDIGNFDYLYWLVLAKLYRVFRYKAKLVENHPESSSHLFCFLDECARLYDSSLDERSYGEGSIPAIAILQQQSRKCGLGLISACNHPSKALPILLSDSYTKFCFRLDHESDVSAMIKAMNGDESHMELVRRLETGYCLVKTGRIPKPFLVKIFSPEEVLR